MAPRPFSERRPHFIARSGAIARSAVKNPAAQQTIAKDIATMRFATLTLIFNQTGKQTGRHRPRPAVQYPDKPQHEGEQARIIKPDPVPQRGV